MLISIIFNLFNIIRIAFTTLIEFLTALLLAIVAALLIVLPWILRAASVLIWLAGAFVGLQTIQIIYSPFTDSIPLFALQFAVIMLMTAWAIAAIKDGKQVWGILIAGGLSIWFFSHTAMLLIDNWNYADIFFRVLPATLFAVGMFYLTIRVKTRRKSEKNSTRLNTQPVSA